MIRLFVTVDEVDAVIAAGYTVIRVYTDTTSTGNFTTLNGTITLVASTDSYEYTDETGVDSTWYRTAYYGAAPGEGTKSAARKGDTRRAYATVEELRADIQKTVTTNDLSLARILDGAAEAIDQYCNRPDGFMADAIASARYYAGSGTPVQRIHECAAISTVRVKASPSGDEDSYVDWTVGTIGTTTSADVFGARGDPQAPTFEAPYTMLIVGATGDYSAFPNSQVVGRGGFTPLSLAPRGLPCVEVSSQWGFSLTPPDSLKVANIMQAARVYKRLQSSMADALASTELGQLVMRQRLDPDVMFILDGGHWRVPAIGRRP